MAVVDSAGRDVRHVGIIDCDVCGELIGPSNICQTIEHSVICISCIRRDEEREKAMVGSNIPTIADEFTQ